MSKDVFLAQIPGFHHNTKMEEQYLKRDDGVRLAYSHTPGTVTERPALMFLGGYRSDMTGTKALYLEGQCRARGQEFVRFDYSGHGASDGTFADGTIGIWTSDARAILDHALQSRDVILAGSSMGGWIALLLGLSCPERIAGIVGISAAPDFTRTMHHTLNDAQRHELEKTGRTHLPGDYSPEPYLVTKALLEDGEAHCLLDRIHDFSMPVRLIQGMKDADVPWQTAYRIKNVLKNADVKVLLIETGDHRLSRSEDLALINTQVREISGF